MERGNLGVLDVGHHVACLREGHQVAGLPSLRACVAISQPPRLLRIIQCASRAKNCESATPRFFDSPRTHSIASPLFRRRG
jgi:hypothetical protein